MQKGKLTIPDPSDKAPMTPSNTTFIKSRTEKLKRSIIAHNSLPENMGNINEVEAM